MELASKRPSENWPPSGGQIRTRRHLGAAGKLVAAFIAFRLRLPRQYRLHPGLITIATGGRNKRGLSPRLARRENPRIARTAQSSHAQKSDTKIEVFAMTMRNDTISLME